jgi:hypothetical protein
MRLADQVVMRGGETSCALFSGRIVRLRPRARALPARQSHHLEVGWDDLKAAEALFTARGVPYRADRLG